MTKISVLHIYNIKIIMLDRHSYNIKVAIFILLLGDWKSETSFRDFIGKGNLVSFCQI